MSKHVYVTICSSRSTYCHEFMAPWRIITGSGLDDWFYWHFPLHSRLITINLLPRSRSILVLVLIFFILIWSGSVPLIHSRGGHIEYISVAQQWIYANHIENTSSSIIFTARCIAMEVIRLLQAYCGRCLLIDILLFRAFASTGMCLETRCLVMWLAQIT
jgi:hypothetical protein